MKCVVCGKQFKTLSTVTKHCSTKCRKAPQPLFPLRVVQKGHFAIVRFR